MIAVQHDYILAAFYDMQGEGCLLLPRSSTSTLIHRPPSRDLVYFGPFQILFCGSSGRRHSITTITYILRYNILVYINIHNKYDLKVCVFLPSKGRVYWLMSVHTVDTIDQEACGKL